MRREYVIDGSQFATLGEFYDHIGSVLIPGQSWGHNLDAFNDILTWPCDDNNTPYELVWQQAALSRERLGYQETIRWLEERVKGRHPSNIAHFVSRLDDAKHNKGQTLFDILVEIIGQNSDYVYLILV